MKTVYRAANAVEGHMIQGLLEQAGLNARVDGDYLQGGAGELAPDGLIRVRVAEDQYDRAREIIDEWDAQPVEPTRYDSDPARRPDGGTVFGVLFGFMAGAMMVAFVYHVPAGTDGIDYTGDGELDTRWIYSAGRLLRVEHDRNFDGEVDFIGRYDHRERIRSAISDERFDGDFDTEYQYRNGNLVWLTSDTTGDGFRNYQREYRYGVLQNASLLDPQTGRPVRVMHFDGFRLVSAEVDSNRDGRLDTRLRYDEFGAVIGESAIP